VESYKVGEKVSRIFKSSIEVEVGGVLGNENLTPMSKGGAGGHKKQKEISNVHKGGGGWRRKWGLSHRDSRGGENQGGFGWGRM